MASRESLADTHELMDCNTIPGANPAGSNPNSDALHFFFFCGDTVHFSTSAWMSRSHPSAMWGGEQWPEAVSGWKTDQRYAILSGTGFLTAMESGFSSQAGHSLLNTTQARLPVLTYWEPVLRLVVKLHKNSGRPLAVRLPHLWR